MDFSIIVPVYFNEGLLETTFARIHDEVIAKNPALRGEVIFVDDGSGDGSFQELLKIREANPDVVTVVKLTRNFGQVNAIRAGFSMARGRCAINISADGQDPPSLISEMLKSHFEDNYEIVVCTRKGRDESAYRIMTSRLFYGLMQKMSFPNMPVGGFDFVLLGRRALSILMQNQEANPFFQGQVLWLGFRIKFLAYQRQKRAVGKSKWTFGKKLTYLLDGVLSYSFLPIRWVSLTGLLVALLGFSYAAIVLTVKVLYGNPIKGWTPLMIVVLVLGGFQMLTLGIFGEYMWRILAQVQGRVPFIIEAVYGQSTQRKDLVCEKN